ncbi:MAG: glutamate 5-kinase [Desulfohalobiaceae bacterium]|nr:glutamate 5-kinase [Desulfohalobiaceae bacterium]
MNHTCGENWRAHRDAILEQARIIVIKVGSAVLTTGGELDLRVVNSLADQVAMLHDQNRDMVLVSSGAVSAGRKHLRFGAEGNTLPEKQASAAVGQSRLMHGYDEAFERFRKSTAQILLTRDDLCSRHRFLNARNTFATLLANRVIPIVNENDTVVVQELNFGDNDFLASLILNLVQADLFINLTTADGVFAGNPDRDPEAHKYDCIASIKQLDLEAMCRGKTQSGAGGMYSKLLAAQRADQLGVPTLIVSGKTRFALEKVFAGHDLGTWILPGQRSVSQRKFWLAYNLTPEGSLVLDDGAKEALLFKGKSLLPAGITSVRGTFTAGDLVELLGSDGKRIGAGLSNYSSDDLARIGGRKTAELPHILGDQAVEEEAVHRDNLLLDVVY